MSNYYGRTDEALALSGGVCPTCPYCGERMFPADDHGRFMCLCKEGMQNSLSISDAHLGRLGMFDP